MPVACSCMSDRTSNESGWTGGPADGLPGRDDKESHDEFELSRRKKQKNVFKLDFVNY